MKKNLFKLLLSLLVTSSCSIGLAWDIGIHPHGYWYGKDAIDQHHVDYQLADALAEFFEKEQATTVVDFGCGTGAYCRVFLDNHISCEGYDGNPDTYNITRGLAQIIDLSESFDLQKHFDWVLSLEVGEHLPKKYEKIFIENLHKHNTKGIILSWAVKGQGGFGHFNERNNDYIKAIMKEYGYSNDTEAENELRKRAKLPWFKNTIMVFRKL